MGTQWARQEAHKNELASVVERTLLWLKYHQQAAVWSALAAAALLLGGWAVFYRRGQAREDSWGRLAVAQSYAYGGQVQPALDLLKTLQEKYPDSAAAGFGLLLAGDVLYQQGKYAESVQNYQAALDRFASNQALLPLSLAALAQAQEAAGEPRKALDSAQRFLDTHQDHFLAPQTHAVLARCYGRLGEQEKAKAAYERIAFLYPDTYWAEWAKVRKG